MLRLDACGRTDRGLHPKRPTNQDGLFPSDKFDESVVFAVVDGMGGYGGGDRARDIALAAIGERAGRAPTDPGEAVTWLLGTLEAANSRIVQEARAIPAFSQMGTTVVLALALEDRLYVVHLGDARAYRLRGHHLERLTRDHLILLEAGLTEEQIAPDHPLRHTISRCLGREPMFRVDEQESEMQEGDVFLLCSDGLSAYVPDATIGGILLNAKTAAQAVDQLVQAALDTGGKDNITVLVIRVLAG